MLSVLYFVTCLNDCRGGVVLGRKISSIETRISRRPGIQVLCNSLLWHMSAQAYECSVLRHTSALQLFALKRRSKSESSPSSSEIVSSSKATSRFPQNCSDNLRDSCLGLNRAMKPHGTTLFDIYNTSRALVKISSMG